MGSTVIRSRKEIIRSILHRAFEENRGAEAILLIQWRKAAANHEAENGIAALEAKLNLLEFNQHKSTGSRALDAFNLKQHIEEQSNPEKAKHRLRDESQVVKKTFQNLLAESDIRVDISFLQAHLKYSDNLALVRNETPDGQSFYETRKSEGQPVLH